MYFCYSALLTLIVKKKIQRRSKNDVYAMLNPYDERMSYIGKKFHDLSNRRNFESFIW